MHLDPKQRPAHTTRRSLAEELGCAGIHVSGVVQLLLEVGCELRLEAGARVDARPSATEAKAVQVLEAATLAAPEHPAALINLAFARLRQGRLRDVEDLCLRIVRLRAVSRSEVATAFAMQAKVHFLSKRPVDAVASYRKAQEICPTTCNNLGIPETIAGLERSLKGLRSDR